jgi:hypothetical protein
MMMLKRTVVVALAAGALALSVAVPGETAAAQGISGQGRSGVPTSCHDVVGGPGGGCRASTAGQ